MDSSSVRGRIRVTQKAVDTLKRPREHVIEKRGDVNIKGMMTTYWVGARG